MMKRPSMTHRAWETWVLLGLAATAAAGEPVASQRAGGTVRLANDRVAVAFNEADGTWQARWPASAPAAVRKVGFAIVADGQPQTPTDVRTETAEVADAIGRGIEVRQRWGKGLEVEHAVRLYDGRPGVLVAAQIINNAGRDVTLNHATMIGLSERDGGAWQLGDPARTPTVIAYPATKAVCLPAADEKSAGQEPSYASTGVLAFARPGSPGGLVIGYLSARQGSPSVSARFRPGQGGTSLKAESDLGKRVLKAGQSLRLDPVWLSREADGFAALERYGDAIAALTRPLLTGANALWCSWYPIRMGINEEIALKHGEIAAKHFKALGLDVIQLDHGWQRGNVCGDWTPNERFPHGLRWLSEQLRSRYGMKLGLWIAPTMVAFNSQLFHDHPEWMMQDANGKPASVGQWFWEPKPAMTFVDAAHPAAEKWIAETFARLTAEGAAYYKIDFIAGSPALGRAMEAIRRGAGPDAWIRYTQTPSLLSVGLANSSNLGDDTGDAGLPDWINLERKNAPLLAASYWTNDRLYHREVCDMSVGMAAPVEEARFRMTLMTLGGCSISFSDDFRALELPRIRMMQQCLPPGNPLGRPLDLFQRAEPSLWHMHCKNAAGQWDAVGMLNFTDQTEDRVVELSALGLPNDAEVIAFEFWEEKFLGVHKGRIQLTLAPRTARIVLIHRRPMEPTVIATNMHVLGGYHEIRQMAWDPKQMVLSGMYRRAPGLVGKAYVYVPDGYRVLAGAPETKGAVRLSEAGKNVWVQEVQFEGAEAKWAIRFEKD
jgi:hypothetical protein